MSDHLTEEGSIPAIHDYSSDGLDNQGGGSTATMGEPNVQGNLLVRRSGSTRRGDASV